MEPLVQATDPALLDVVRAVSVGVIWIALASLVREPVRQMSQAIILGVAAGAYLNGGFGAWEFAGAIVVGYCAYRGLSRYAWLGIGWLVHTAWDIAHHVSDQPMISWLPTSAVDCAITDPIIAVWFLFGAPSIFAWLRRKSSTPSVA